MSLCWHLVQTGHPHNPRKVVVEIGLLVSQALDLACGLDHVVAGRVHYETKKN